MTRAPYITSWPAFSLKLFDVASQTIQVLWMLINYLLSASSLSMSLFNLANAASLLSLHTLDKGIRCPDHQLSPSLVEILQGHCRTHACLQSSHLVVVYLFSYLYLVLYALHFVFA